MGEVVEFAEHQGRRRARSEVARMDRARRDWTVLSGYDREAAGAAMTEFYRIWFAAAARDGYFDQGKPADTE